MIRSLASTILYWDDLSLCRILSVTSLIIVRFCFFAKAELNRIIDVCSIVRISIMESSVIESVESVKPFCAECKRVFKTSRGLLIHQRHCKSKTVEPDANCNAGDFLFKKVRVLGTEDNLMFVAKDVGVALRIKNIRNFVATCSAEERNLCVVHTAGGDQRMTVLIPTA